MSAPKPTCPDWCSNHDRIHAGSEKHTAEIVYETVWHSYLQRNEDLAVTVEQYVGEGVTGEGYGWTNGRPQARVIAANLDAHGCRDVADALCTAAELLTAAEGGRPHLSLRKALRIWIEDAGGGSECDVPGCSDGTGPVCDISTFGCVLNRILLDPSTVHDLIKAEHEWSGIE
ncbi:hypothetical protein [Cellulomonas endometrii]|uniref:hypothetical protein n=1 Tax=Cellulomonas endometrii TaxID=3036301 RepID=UPI0024ADF9DA|nr:hypothetical protein [Cellulomonas endometrii]